MRRLRAPGNRHIDVADEWSARRSDTLIAVAYERKATGRSTRLSRPHRLGRPRRGRRAICPARDSPPRPRGARRSQRACEEERLPGCARTRTHGGGSMVKAAERIAAAQAAVALEQTLQEVDTVVRSCAVVVGAFPAGARLESILASHALAHAAEGRLYQRALLQGAESLGLDAAAVPKRSIWEEGASALGVAPDELRHRIDDLRREIGPPWAEDQKLAALAGWIALAQSFGLQSRT